MASIDGGTLASQKELKCQINSVRAPDTQEFLYLAPWEADKDRLCVSEQALTKHWGCFLFFFFFTPLLTTSTSSSSSSFSPLPFERQRGSVSVDVTPGLAQHLPCVQPAAAACVNTETAAHAHSSSRTRPAPHPPTVASHIKAASRYFSF